MQCVLIAAGRGTRMMPLTESVPKPLLLVAGKTILDHIVLALPQVIIELVLVVGYRADQIRAHCGGEFHGLPVTYVEQADYTAGTGDALLCAKNQITGKFLFMYADDIHGATALERVTQLDHGMLAMQSSTPERFGVLVLNKDGTLQRIIEKPAHPPSQLVNIGGFVVEPTLLEYVPRASNSGEAYVTDMLTEYAQEYPVQIVEQTSWIPVGYPEDIQKAEHALKLHNNTSY